MLVSIVTPCLNPGARLERCLASVAAQTHGEVEHIVVDAGSTDGTLEVLEAAGVTFVSEPDGGQTEAINKGFRLARGELLGWLNADDVLLPRTAETVVAAVQSDPAAGWAYGDCIVEAGRRRYVARPPSRLVRGTLDAGNVIAQPGAFVARSALERVGDLDESLTLAMDYDLWLRLLDAGVPAVYVREPLAVFEVHGDSKTGSSNVGAFFREEGLALLKSGRRRQAAFAFGRSAAALGVPVDEVLPESELDRRAALAGVQTESAVHELKSGSPRGLLRLIRPRVWRQPEARARMLLLARAALGRLDRRGL
jgi:glycosyltransferase involved in cell wall biosynthesis